jgi:Tfp pilus assembly protein PilF
MWKRFLLFLPLLACTASPARDKVVNWVEVRSPHFIVATNASDKQARRIAAQFERMRSVFHVLFPKLQMDPDSPIIVIAIKDDKEFRALEPEAYLGKGQLKLGGLFLRAADKNYVLMRVDAEGEHPYSVIYHEYTHLLLAKAAEWMPLWLNEGLAEFYQNTDIHEKDVALGQPSSEDIELLRQSRLLPLPTLFAVDAKSPYYHEENKGSIFYAESWALTHYIRIKDFQEKTHHLTDYIDLLAKKMDPPTAATTAFGDLKRLQDSLFVYIQQGRFSYFGMKTTTEVDDSAFQAQPLTAPQADALCANFLAYNQRTKDARALLDHVLQEDPKNVSAHETMGFLEFRQGHIDEAKKWYAGAVQLDSQSYLAHYYFAAMSMLGSLEPSGESQVENSLRQAIKLNPSFAPSFDRLAVFLGSRQRNLDEAHMMGLTAVSLDPGNVGYRINVANVLMAMQRGQSAVEVLQNAVKLAKTPEESQFVENALMHAQAYAASQQEMAQQKQRMAEEATVQATSSDGSDVPRLAHRDFVPRGPHRFVTGILQNVRCDSSEMDLSVKAGGKTTAFHSDNYYRIQYSSLGFQPQGELQPCRDLEGRPAKVEYEESANKADTARPISIELHK